MSKTIQELLVYLEELEKRIKAMSKAHTTLELLIEITSYFDTVQHYLNDLEDSFDTHTTNCNAYATQIAEIQEQIATINSKIQNSSGSGDFDATEINTKLENLTTNLSNLETKFNSFIGENDTTLDTIVCDISALQTEVADLQDQIDTINTEISNINETIGSMQTTITNLSSTQNSLSSAQNSMSANINSLDTRLTTAENNISVLTGGVDVSEFDARITTLEDENGFNNHYAYKKATYNLTPTDFKLFTPEYYFCSTTNGYTELKLNLLYENISATQITVEFYINKNLINTFNVDLTKNTANYEIIYKYRATMNGQSLKLKCTADSSIKYTNLEMELHGANVHFFDYDKNVKVHCFDNQAFITKIENGIAYYGAIPSTETIDLNNLPNQKALQSDDGSYLTIEYVPMSSSANNYFTEYVYAMMTENSANERYLTVIDKNNSTSTSLVDKTMKTNNCYYNDIFWTIGGAPLTVYFNPNTRKLTYTMAINNLNTFEFKDLNSHLDGNWTLVTSVAKNGNVLNSKYIDRFDTKVIGINRDGVAYLLGRINMDYFNKIGKGLYAKAYEEIDETINVYLSDYEKTDKYKLTLNSNKTYDCTFVQTIEDCDCVYETFNNIIIKHTVSTNSWIVDTLEY